MEINLSNINSDGDNQISILLYIKNNVNLEVEIQNIQSGHHTDQVINRYFQNSPDYQKLFDRITAQREKVIGLANAGGNIYFHEAKKLSELEENEKEFKSGTLRLAETFLKIEPRTERLKKARELFEQGRILDADAILIAEDMQNEQDDLIAQMDYLQARKSHFEQIYSSI